MSDSPMFLVAIIIAAGVACARTLPPEPPAVEVITSRPMCEPNACWAKLPAPDACGRKP